MEREKREYCKSITRKELEEMGIIEVIPDGDSWKITRTWFKNNSKTKMETRTLPIYVIKGKSKYVEPKEYLKVSFSYKGEQRDLPLHRLVWAWCKGPVPEGYEIDHINNNSFDNRLDNLQLLTTYENKKKRWSNPNNGKNQWEYMDDFDKAAALYERRARKRLKEIQKSLKEFEKEIDEIKNR